MHREWPALDNCSIILGEDALKKLALTAVLLALPPLPALAALSGFYDSGEQISAILSSEAVGSALGQAPYRRHH